MIVRLDEARPQRLQDEQRRHRGNQIEAGGDVEHGTPAGMAGDEAAELEPTVVQKTAVFGRPCGHAPKSR
ncbi:hypothetical protein ABMY26_29540 [Azospirillum sp. HJ39]|uniref:hypothetical protein n=1 Tax=Azospirillum sp. HJ39 TaxID=3159496 RepID=UPI0035581B58